MKVYSFFAIILSFLISSIALAGGIHTDPEVDQVIAEASDLYLNAKFDEGIKLLEQLEKTSPGNPAVSFFTANGYWWKIFRVYVYDSEAEATPYDESFDRYLNLTIDRSEKLLDRNSKDVAALFYIGNSYCLKSRVKGLKGSYFGAGRDAAKGKKYLEKVLDLDPRQYDAYYNIGVYNYLAGTLPGYAKFLKALLFFPGGDREKGLSLLKLAAQKSTYFSAESQLILARFYADFEEQPGDALRIVQAFHKTYPENAWFHYWAGTLLSDELNNYPEAERVYTEILQKCELGLPSYTNEVRNHSMLKLARVRSRMLYPEKAIQEINDMLALKPKEPSWITARAYLELGNTYDQIGMRENAVTAYRKVLAYPNHRDFHEQARKLLNQQYNQKLANIYRLNLEGRRKSATGDFAGAEAAFQEVLREFPNNDQTLYAMAEMYYLKGSYNDAISLLKRILDRRPKEPKWLVPGVYVRLGQNYQARKEQEAARQSYEKALDTEFIMSDDRNLAKRALQQIAQNRNS